MEDDNFGYDQSRFVQVGDQFECVICVMVVKNPQECSGCGHLFCKKCIDDWMKKNSRECPNRCSMSSNSISSISKALLRMYNNLDIKCKNFTKCNTTLKLSDLEKHEGVCSQPQCANFQNCSQFAKQEFLPKNSCSLECSTHLDLLKAGSQAEYLQIIQEFSKKLQQRAQAAQGSQVFGLSQSANLGQGSVLNQNQQGSVVSVASNQNVWKWDLKAGGTGIKTFDGGINCFLSETSYMFRTILGDTAMNGGCHYWQIHADSKTENEIKVGISTKKDFNYNSAFCDFDYGYAYYGLGQLRHGSNASGPQYGKRFKKEGVLGIYLNMNKGTLSFALNGEFFGVGFTDDKLKAGPIYPAVSLLHQAGCTIKSGVQVPAYFQGC